MYDAISQLGIEIGFGLASKTKRVGVFSVARYRLSGLVDPCEVVYSCCKVMLHESAHMFGLKHCVYYRCLMNGAMSAEEEAKKPICMATDVRVDMCPVCMRKLQNALGFDFETYLQALGQLICEAPLPQLAKDAEWYRTVVGEIESREKKPKQL